MGTGRGETQELPSFPPKGPYTLPSLVTNLIWLIRSWLRPWTISTTAPWLNSNILVCPPWPPCHSPQVRPYLQHQRVIQIIPSLIDIFRFLLPFLFFFTYLTLMASISSSDRIAIAVTFPFKWTPVPSVQLIPPEPPNGPSSIVEVSSVFLI